MDQSFQAIFEHGVLRPLAPLQLSEDEIVSVIVARSNEAKSVSVSAADHANRQREILMRFVAKMELMADESPKDGLSNRDHDRLIYGS